MNKKSIQETSNQDFKSKFVQHKEGMPIIRCACGFEILVLPDLRAMNRAIKNHINGHKPASCGSECILAINWLEEFLTEQVLIVASKMNFPTVN